MNIKTGFINGKRVFAFRDKDEFLMYLEGKEKILVALNAEKLNKTDQELTELINDNIGYADGIGAVWALKRKGLRAVKIAGAEFWLDIIARYRDGWSFYFLGSSQEVIDATVIKLRQQFPGILIAGYHSGYLDPGDDDRIMTELAQKKPDMIFVAMGSPRQEFLMSRFMQRYPALYMGLGGSFDVYSGNKKRAPQLFIKLGLEWLYRLLKEPTRISRQFILIKFFFKIIFGKL